MLESEVRRTILFRTTEKRGRYYLGQQKGEVDVTLPQMYPMSIKVINITQSHHVSSKHLKLRF